MPTVNAIASAIVADSERKPAKSASVTWNQTFARSASGEKALSVMATTGSPWPTSWRADSAVEEA